MHKPTLLLLFLFCSINIFAQSPAYEPGQLLIKWKPNRTASQKTSLKNRLGVSTLKNYHRIGIELLTVNTGQSNDAEHLAAELRQHPAIEFAEPDYLLSSQARLPNETNFSDLWGFNNTGQDGGEAGVDINAEPAWDIRTGSPDVTVAIIDTGIDWDHEDLIDNIWQNLGEDADGDGHVLEFINGSWVFDPGDENGIDDDGNGFIDDFIGWDFRNNDNNPDDDNFRGTHSAGIIGAVGDNTIGVAGVSWDINLAALKFTSATGIGSVSNAIAALEYAIDMGFPISNNGYGLSGFSTAIETAIQAASASGHLFIAEAGNRNTNNDLVPYYPSGYDLDNIISVGSINRFGLKAPTSSYGPTTVDLVAPGDEILSTFPGNIYNEIGGTAAATAYVSGACALLIAAYPNLTHLEIREAIIWSAIPMIDLTDRVDSDGRLNLLGALEYFDPPPPPTTVCGSVFMDAAEAAGCYNNNQYTLNTLCPDNPGDIVSATFTFFDVEQSYDDSCPDVLRVFDGPDNLSPSLGEYCGQDNSFIPGPFTSTHASGCLTFEFQSDGSVVRNGWNALIDCIIGQACSVRDSMALVALYNSTDGANWTNPWIQTDPMSTWSGVTLSPEGCVTSLFLVNRGLNGTLPPELGNLDDVTSLGMSNNMLSGQLPDAVGNLTNLQFFYFNNNQLTGNIPSGLGASTNLLYLGLENNQLSGEIPADLGALGQLSVMTLRNNNLTGTIPATFANLISLTSIFLDGNNLTGDIPGGFANITTLMRTDLQFNNFNFDGLETIAASTIPDQRYVPQNNVTLLEAEGVLTAEAGGTIPNNTYIWFLDSVGIDTVVGNNTYAAELSGAYHCEIYNNIVTIIGDANRELTLTTNTIDFVGELVWPGDTNYDGIVDFGDFNYFSLFASNTGPARPNATTDWVGQPCPDWTNEDNGLNGKYQDCDGDGTVAFGIDDAVIFMNMGQTHPVDQISASSNGTEYILERGPITAVGELRYSITLQRFGSPVMSHGFSCRISLGDIPVDSIHIDTTGSCLQPQIFWEAFDPTANIVNLAISRTDGADMTCGIVGYLVVHVNNSIGLGQEVVVSGGPGTVLNSLGEESSASGNVVSWNYSETGGSSTNMQLSVAGSPEECTSMGEATVLIDGGIAPYTISWSTGEVMTNVSETTVTLSNLSAGIYTVTVTDSNDPFILNEEMIVEVEGQFVPFYDENGMLVDCGAATCPEAISLVNVVSGIHQAGSTINSNGKILFGTNAELNAGGSILLEAGFSMEPGATLSIDIQACGN